MKIMKVLDKKECNFPLAIQFTAMKYNLKEIRNLLNFSKRYGLILRIRPINPSEGNLNTKKLMIPYEKYLDLIKTIEALKSSLKINKSGLNLKQGNMRFDYSKRTIKFSSSVPPYLGFGCPGGNLHCFVDPYGYVSPCGFILKSFFVSKEDNIRTKNLYKIWHGGKSFIKKRNLKGNNECKSCKYYPTCRGDVE